VQTVGTMDIERDIDTRPAEAPPVDSVLLVGFGGPEGPDDVLPFLENVTRGRGVPPERLLEVSRHYPDVFGGVSPINAQARALQQALRQVLRETGPDLPVYWGNRNWHPMLSDTLRQLADDGRRHALAVVTSAFPSYSGCRQYREDIARHLGPGGPVVTKLRHYYCAEGFLNPMRRNVARAAEGLRDPRLVFTAHSIPLVMAETSGPAGGAYVEALRTASAAVAGDRPWDLVFQSRSGSPSTPWLEPDVSDHLRSLARQGVDQVVLVPIGFTSDHVEVLYDLDVQARATADGLGLTMTRAATVGTDREFVAMLAGLVRERIAAPLELGTHGCVATHDRCPAHCCPAPLSRR
jgi:ferrochelatase